MLDIKTPAPNFKLLDQNGKEHTLAYHRGSYVLIYFYPKDDTPDCTKEACTIRDMYKDFESNGVKVFGISADSVESHKKFAEKYQLPFTLLSDPKKEVIKAYGADGAIFNKRISYLVGLNGMIEKVYPKNVVTDTTWSGSGQMPADWSELVPELGKEDSDFVITKKQWGAFYGTELDLQLRRRKIDTIVLCGIATCMGVESTARFAYEYGYNQIFAEDAMSSMSKEEHEHTVRNIFPRIGLVRTTKEILEAL